MPEGSSEIKEIAYIRAIAQIMIIGAHLQFVVPWNDRLDLIRLVRPFFENATFPFFILSGLLLSIVNSQTSYKDFLRKKIKSVIVPYFFAIIPIIIIFLFFSDFFEITNKIYFMSDTTPEVFLTSGRNSVNIAMWFFPVICAYFLVSPVFRWLQGQPLILVAFVIATFFLSNFTHRPPSTSEFLRSFQYFLFPYSLGLLMGRFFETSQRLLQKTCWINFSLFVIVYYLQVEYGALGGLDRLEWEKMSLTQPDLSLLQKLFFTLFLLGFFTLKILPHWLDHLLRVISKHSFDVHLYHGYFITFCILSFGKWESGYGLGMFLVQYAFVTLACFGFCILRAKFHRRLIA